MRQHPLALSDAGLKLIERAARSLPVARRDEFLRDVAARLGDAPTMLAIEAAIGSYFERLPVKEITS